MKRMLVGVYVYADHEGKIISRATHFPILKESAKMVHPDLEGMSYDDKKTIRGLKQIRKPDLGWVHRDTTSTSFSYQSCDIVETSEELNDLIRKVVEKGRMELADRRELLDKWEIAYKEHL